MRFYVLYTWLHDVRLSCSWIIYQNITSIERYNHLYRFFHVLSERWPCLLYKCVGRVWVRVNIDAVVCTKMISTTTEKQNTCFPYCHGCLITYRRYANSDERSPLTASVPMLICVPGSVAGGALTERVGPRRLQMALCPVLALAFLGMPAAAWVCARESDYLQGLLILCRVIQVKVLPFGISSFRIYVLHLMSHIAPLAHRPDEADLNCMLYIACFWTVTSIACFKLHVSGLILSLVNQTTMHLKRPWPFSQTVQSGRSLGFNL